jgi:hypothetical protein
MFSETSSTFLKPYIHNGQSIQIPFMADAFFNATVAAKPFDKSPKDWLKTEDTQAYIGAIRRKILLEENQLVRVANGAPSTGGGTWLHPKLGVVFARWLNADFAVWADEQITAILSGELAGAVFLQPRLFFAAARIARGIDLARDAGVKQALIWELKAIHGHLGLPFPAIHLFGKDPGQMQLEV